MTNTGVKWIIWLALVTHLIIQTENCRLQRLRKTSLSTPCREAVRLIFTEGWMIDGQETISTNGWSNTSITLLEKIKQGQGICVLYRTSYENTDTCCSGWVGPNCEQANCSRPCLHGNCTGPNVCTCLEGWSGDVCDENIAELNDTARYCYRGNDCRGEKIHNATAVSQEVCCKGSPNSSWGQQKFWGKSGQCLPCESARDPHAAPKNRAARVPFRTCVAGPGCSVRTFDGVSYRYCTQCPLTLLRSASLVITELTKCAHPSSCYKEVNITLPDRQTLYSITNYSLSMFSDGQVRSLELLNETRFGNLAHTVGELQLEVIKGSLFLTLNRLQLRVRRDDVAQVFVTLGAGSSLRGDNLMGACGNYDDDVSDEVKLLGYAQQAESYGLPVSRGPCSSLEPEFTCTVSEPQEKFLEDMCSKLQVGIFAKCNSVVDVRPYKDSCRHPYCPANVTYDQQTAAWCATLSAYATVCAMEGVELDWRAGEDCRRTCPANMTYSKCGSTCQPTCGQPLSSFLQPDCGQHCADPGCYCNPGLILHNGSCILPTHCPCVYRGVAHPRSYLLSVPETCQLCTCQEFGQWNCTEEKLCRATCSVDGPGVVTTFDGEEFVLGSRGGPCNYTLVSVQKLKLELTLLTGPCNDSKSEAVCPLGFRLTTESLRLEGGFSQSGGFDHLSVVSRDQQSLPVLQGSTYVREVTSRSVVADVFGFRITAYARGHVTVTSDTARYFGMTRGLCGNLNNLITDERLLPSGAEAQGDDEFLAAYSEEGCGTVLSLTPIPAHSPQCAALRQLYQDWNQTSDTLEAVHQICMFQGGQVSLCSALFKLAVTTGQSLRSLLDRQSEFFKIFEPCNLEWTTCDEGLIYQEDVDVCASSCTDLAVGEGTCRSETVRGCSCIAGFFRAHNGTCVVRSQCPCLNVATGQYHQPGLVLDIPCHQCLCSQGKLTCEEKGCERMICPQNQVATIVNYDNGKCLQKQCPDKYSNRAICADKNSPLKTCVCKEGFLLTASGVCVPSGTCPCYHDGVWHHNGTDINEQCYVKRCQDGDWKIVDKVQCPATCSLSGIEARVETFDGSSYLLPATLNTYTVVKSVGNAPGFQITFISHICLNAWDGIDCGYMVDVHFMGVDLRLVSGLGLQVGNRTYPLEDTVTIGNIQVANTMLYTVISFLGVSIYWSGGHLMWIQVSNRWVNQLEGLCGTYDHNSKNDFLAAAGSLETDSAQFALSWKLEDQVISPAWEPNSCQITSDKQDWFKIECNIIKTSEIFKGCREAMPQSHVDRYESDCRRSACHCREAGNMQCYCDSVAHFASVCDKLGHPVKWRHKDLCPVQCEGGMVYGFSHVPCHRTCHDLARNLTSCQVIGTTEGCFCPLEHVWHGSRCIPVTDCPCFDGHFMYEPGTVLKKDRCTQCECMEGRFDCRSGNCSECLESEFRCSTSGVCIPRSSVCNDQFDCYDGSDENSELCENNQCTDTQFQCTNSLECIPLIHLCDGLAHCSDGTDEAKDSCISCAVDKFKCFVSQACIDRQHVCDGHDDCGDGSDELGCRIERAADEKTQKISILEQLAIKMNQTETDMDVNTAHTNNEISMAGETTVRAPHTSQLKPEVSLVSTVVSTQTSTPTHRNTLLPQELDMTLKELTEDVTASDKSDEELLDADPHFSNSWSKKLNNEVVSSPAIPHGNSMSNVDVSTNQLAVTREWERFRDDINISTPSTHERILKTTDASTDYVNLTLFETLPVELITEESDQTAHSMILTTLEVDKTSASSIPSKTSITNNFDTEQSSYTEQQTRKSTLEIFTPKYDKVTSIEDVLPDLEQMTDKFSPPMASDTTLFNELNTNATSEVLNSNSEKNTSINTFLKGNKSNSQHMEVFATEALTNLSESQLESTDLVTAETDYECTKNSTINKSTQAVSVSGHQMNTTGMAKGEDNYASNQSMTRDMTTSSTAYVSNSASEVLTVTPMEISTSTAAALEGNRNSSKHSELQTTTVQENSSQSQFESTDLITAETDYECTKNDTIDKTTRQAISASGYEMNKTDMTTKDKNYASDISITTDVTLSTVDDVADLTSEVLTTTSLEESTSTAAAPKENNNSQHTEVHTSTAPADSSKGQFDSTDLVTAETDYECTKNHTIEKTTKEAISVSGHEMNSADVTTREGKYASDQFMTTDITSSKADDVSEITGKTTEAIDFISDVTNITSQVTESVDEVSHLTNITVMTTDSVNFISDVTNITSHITESADDVSRLTNITVMTTDSADFVSDLTNVTIKTFDNISDLPNASYVITSKRATMPETTETLETGETTEGIEISTVANTADMNSTSEMTETAPLTESPETAVTSTRSEVESLSSVKVSGVTNGTLLLSSTISLTPKNPKVTKEDLGFTNDDFTQASYQATSSFPTSPKTEILDELTEETSAYFDIDSSTSITTTEAWNQSIVTSEASSLNTVTSSKLEPDSETTEFTDFISEINNITGMTSAPVNHPNNVTDVTMDSAKSNISNETATPSVRSLQVSTSNDTSLDSSTAITQDASLSRPASTDFMTSVSSDSSKLETAVSSDATVTALETSTTAALSKRTITLTDMSSTSSMSEGMTSRTSPGSTLKSTLNSSPSSFSHDVETTSPFTLNVTDAELSHDQNTTTAGIRMLSTSAQLSDCPQDCLSSWSCWSVCPHLCQGVRVRTRGILRQHSTCTCSDQVLTQAESCACRNLGPTPSPDLTQAPAECQCTSPSKCMACFEECEQSCRAFRTHAVCQEHDECKPGCKCPPGQLMADHGHCMEASRCPCYDSKGTEMPFNSSYIDPTTCQVCRCSEEGSICEDRQDDMAMLYEWEEWSQWSKCSADCGNGTSIRFRVGTYHECRHRQEESRPCCGKTCHCVTEKGELVPEGDLYKPDACRVCKCTSGDLVCTTDQESMANGVWSQWDEWSPCEYNCSLYYQTRSRHCKQPACGGLPCQGSGLQFRVCAANPCCHVYKLSEWTPCSQTCGPLPGQQTRHRVYADKLATNKCDPHLEQKECGRCSCTDNDTSTWSQWTPCANGLSKCGWGKKYRYRTVSDKCLKNGVDSTESQDCFLGSCRCEDGKVWSNHTQCSRSCHSEPYAGCSLLLSGGCVCRHDLVSQGEDCIPASRCSHVCVYKNTTYQEGQTFNCDNCTRCQCNKGQIHKLPNRCTDVKSCNLNTHQLVPSADGCCLVDCIPLETCQVQLGTAQYYHVNNCTSVKPIQQALCTGPCPEQALNSSQHSPDKKCLSCLPKITVYKGVELRCENQTSLIHPVPFHTECQCQ